MVEISVTRSLKVPDRIRIARYRRVPELGPRILFFSGGSSLKKLSRTLTGFTHNSVHLITPFDSGGSSATLRKAFNMLAVGDIRNRLNALADQSVHGNREVYELFAYRFPKVADNAGLLAMLQNFAAGRHSMVSRVPNPMQRIIRNHLHGFIERMPEGFDLQGANIGNIVLASGYLNNRRHIEPVIYMFSKMVEARGIVRPITGLSYHLAAELEDGTLVAGQHRITGTNGARQSVKKRAIRKLYLIKELDPSEPATVTIKPKIRDLIKSAELICYPFGSFYTSLIANFLPKGVGQAVSNNNCPKVFIPNPVSDSEQSGMSLDRSIDTLIDYLQNSSEEKSDPETLLNIIIIDRKNGIYPKPFSLMKTAGRHIQVIDTVLISEKSRPYIDDDILSEVLLSLV